MKGNEITYIDGLEKTREYIKLQKELSIFILRYYDYSKEDEFEETCSCHRRKLEDF
jgi:hypothetical protein